MIISTYNLFKEEWMVYIDDGKVIHKAFSDKVTVWTILLCWLYAKIYRPVRWVKRTINRIKEALNG